MVFNFRPRRPSSVVIDRFETIQLICPDCGETHIVKNGNPHSGKQNYLCQTCGRQFVAQPVKRIVSQQTRDLIDKLLLERVSLAGIARVAGVSESWLQTYVNIKYSNVPRFVTVSPKKRGKLVHLS